MCSKKAWLKMRINLEWTCANCGHENYYNTGAHFDLHRKGEFNITTCRLFDELICKKCGTVIKVTRGKPGFINVEGVA